MFTQYVDAIMRRVRFERVTEDKKYFASIRGFRGVWATGKTKRECARELREVLEEWLILKIRKQQFVPTLRQYDLNKLLASA